MFLCECALLSLVKATSCPLDRFFFNEVSEWFFLSAPDVSFAVSVTVVEFLFIALSRGLWELSSTCAGVSFATLWDVLTSDGLRAPKRECACATTCRALCFCADEERVSPGDRLTLVEEEECLEAIDGGLGGATS